MAGSKSLERGPPGLAEQSSAVSTATTRVRALGASVAKRLGKGKPAYRQNGAFTTKRFKAPRYPPKPSKKELRKATSLRSVQHIVAQVGTLSNPALCQVGMAHMQGHTEIFYWSGIAQGAELSI